MDAELRIEISRLGNRYLAITRRHDGLEILRSEFHHDLLGSAEPHPLWQLDQGRPDSESVHQVQRNSRDSTKPSRAAAEGRRLYHYLFGDGRALQDYLARRQSAEPPQLTVSIDHDAYGLWRLPWEYLYDGERFCCLNGIRVHRRPVNLRTLTPQPDLAPLRILVIVANPEDQAPFDAVAEQGVLLASLEPLISQGAVDLEILTEPTASALLSAVQENVYQAIHFIGHGVYHLAQNQGFLCLEDDVGRTELLSGAQLPRFLEGWPPRLFLISACPSAQIGVRDAFTNVAEALLDHGVPGVVTTAPCLEAPAATAFYNSMYSGIATGLPVAECLQQGRLALKELDNGRAANQQRFIWGLPALYLRAPDLRLIQTVTPADAEGSGDQTPEPGLTADRVGLGSIIGRKQELQAIRKALRAGDRLFYIWGSEGIGKRHLISHLLSRWNPKPSAVLRIRCREMVEPLAVLWQIASFWRSAVNATREATEMLLDPRLNPYERARSAMQQVNGGQVIYVFEDLDAWFDDDVTAPGALADATIGNILLGLLSAPGRAVFFFTGARRWADFARIATGNQREVHIPLLPLQSGIRLMHRWPELRHLSAEQKQAIYWHLGGHPKAMRFLASWLRCGGDLASLLTDLPVTDRATQDWIVYLAREILAQLDPGAFEVLRSLAVVKQPFSTALISRLTPVTPEHAARLVEKWQRLGLLERRDPDDPNSLVVETTIQRIVSADLTTDEASALHLQMARTYGAPLVDAARRQVLARNITGWSQERVAWLASDTNGVLGLWLRHPPEDMETAEILENALAWQYHLAQAGEDSAAAHIVQTITPELNHQGQRDLARKLAQQTAGSAEAIQAALDWEPPLNPSSDVDRLTTAVRAYERAYEALDPEAPGAQRANLLIRLSEAHERLGHRQAVVQCLEIACEALRQEHEAREEAECLYKLAVAYRGLSNHQRALVYSQAALELFEALTLPHGLAAAKREQGQILRELGYLDQALERFAASLLTCRELDDRAGVVANLTDIGLLLERLGRTEMAIQVIEEALDRHEYLRSPDHGDILSLLERLYARQQRLNEAMARFRTTRHGAEASL